MTPRRPTAGFWITVALVAVLVGYPLSFGPACWAIAHRLLPRKQVAAGYSPLIRTAWILRPNIAGKTLKWYAGFCGGFDGLIALGEELGI